MYEVKTNSIMTLFRVLVLLTILATAFETKDNVHQTQPDKLVRYDANNMTEAYASRSYFYIGGQHVNTTTVTAMLGLDQASKAKQ